MCEFKVYVRDGDGERRVAEEIVRSSLEGGGLVLSDILGSRVVMEDSLMRDLNVALERIDLLQLPGLGKLVNFLQAYSRAVESREYDDGLQDDWEGIKGFWDERLGQLREICDKK
jgi:predicted RNA-binding protein